MVSLHQKVLGREQAVGIDHLSVNADATEALTAIVFVFDLGNVSDFLVV
jgi:hypothetical protein